MKNFSIKTAAVAAFVTCACGISAYGAIDLSTCLDDCKTKRTSSQPCCCPSGTKVTTHTCPTGWIYDYDDAADDYICQRNPTTGSDTKGIYTQNYGTCEATTGTCDGYKPSTSHATTCFCLSN